MSKAPIRTAPRQRPGILYISYDGMLEPLGQSQVLSYLEPLADEFHIRLISFEKARDWVDIAERRTLQDRIRASGIVWMPLRYHKKPTGPATAYDLMIGTITALYQTIRHRIRILHARSDLPGLMALVVKWLTGSKFLFDMRGFWADERIDAGIWRADTPLYRWAKRLERRLLRRADHIVTLTHASADEIRTFPYLDGARLPITIIPTCADLERFTRSPRPSDRPFTFGFVGAAGTWSLFDQVLTCFQFVLEERPDARLLVINRNEHDFIRDRIAAGSIDPTRVEIVAATHRDVPSLISRMDAGAAIRKFAYSQLACAPTKLAEYLGCGIPCLSNEGIGDVKTILEEARVGIVLRDFSPAEVRQGVRRLIGLAEESDIAERCVATAQKYFALDAGVRAYAEIYRQLARADQDRRL